MSRVIEGDCRAVLAEMPADTFDAVVTDPPYHLTSIVKRFSGASAATETFAISNPTNIYKSLSAGFMGKAWDGGGVAFDPETWRAVLRVMKPGAHLLAFGGTRTSHRMVCALEDAGFEIRDTLCWLYGQGFPKSLDVSKAIDRAAGAEREVVGRSTNGSGPNQTKIANHGPGDTGMGTWDGSGQVFDITAPATPEAAQWAGWGTALKPAHEPIVLARKPLSESTVAANVLRYGTGAINIDATRIPTDDALGGGGEKAETAGKFTNEGWRRPWMDDPDASEAFAAKVRANVAKAKSLGRWPANVCHDGSPEVLALFPQSDGCQPHAINGSNRQYDGWGSITNKNGETVGYPGFGSAARFFYTAKADAADRADSRHPTVKPVDLLRWLVRMICPPGGHILDPFAGSGTTAEAAMLEGFDCTLVEQDPASVADIRHRMNRWHGGDMPLFAAPVPEPPEDARIADLFREPEAMG